MPLYEINHICKLSEDQQDKLAEAITEAHSNIFTTPRLFVNVQFINYSGIPTYVGGKRRPNNKIIGHVRQGPSRTMDMWQELCNSINSAWKKYVGDSGDQELRALFVIGGIFTGSEAGFSIPEAGKDAEWLQENVVAFKKLAKAGDTDFQDMLEELKSRDAFKEIIEGQVNGS